MLLFQSPLRGVAVAAAICLAGLLVMTLITGANQQAFEIVRAPADYATALTHVGTAMRGIIALDDVFIAFYVSLTLLLVRELPGAENAQLRTLIVVFGVAAGVLDYAENHHILALLRAADAGQAIPLSELTVREDLSSLKWMLGHLAFFLVGLCLPTQNFGLRLFRFALLYVQLPVGALTLVMSDPHWSLILHWARLLNVLAGFALTAWLFPLPRAGATGAPA
jgi:hypothetical protein